MYKLLAILLLVSSTSFSGLNVLLIMADDYGADASFLYGCDTNATPNIDSIALDGIRFERMITASTCAPTRAMLMTGRTSFRNGVTITASDSNLSSNEVTIANVLQDVGIETGVFGKWNLWGSGNGFATQEVQLDYFGWDTHYTFPGNLPGYSGWETQETYNVWITMTNCVEFIRDNSDKQFFCYYSPRLVHAPYFGTPDSSTPANATDGFWDYMEYLDGTCISNVLAVLDEQGIASNTVVIFLGDNGTDGNVNLSFDGNAITGAKGGVDEASVRVPFYIRWPDVVDSGITNSGLYYVHDIPVTIAHIMGTEMPTDRLIDGRTLLYDLTLTNYAGRVNGFMGVNDNNKSTYRYSGYKIYDTGSFVWGLKDVSLWPYGDTIIAEFNIEQTNILNMMSINADNFLSKSLGDNVWGGHSNEVIYSESAP